MSIVSFHHVQVLCPVGAEPSARAFYHELLGLHEIEKPPTLSRDGVWYSVGTLELHVGVLRPGDSPSASRAHFALQVTDLTAFIDRLRSAGAPIIQADPVPGWRRVYTADPFGNRIELIEVMSESDQS